MNYFISDLHFGHKNCLSFDNRPFNTIEEHDAHIIEQWNNTVNANDDVYILGDVSWHKAATTISILKQLNGSLHLIIGNHDGKLLRNPEVRKCFVEITHYKELDIGKGYAIVLSHYPIPCFKNHYYGWFHLYGHVHLSFEWCMMEEIKEKMITSYNKQCQMFNVGAMMTYINYIPKTLDEIIKYHERIEEVNNE